MRAAMVVVAFASLQATASLDTTLARLHAYLTDYEPQLTRLMADEWMQQTHVRPTQARLGESTWRELKSEIAQEIGELDRLVDQLGQYLIAYESQLTTVVADETYEQSELRPASRTSLRLARKRKLASDIAFLRLPGESLWFGVREVRTVDGKPVVTNEGRLRELLKKLDAGSLEQAAKIVAHSSQYNLGGLRTVNMPTTPLEILHPDHHVQFEFKLRNTSKIDGTPTRRLDFEEFDVPTLVSGTNGAPVFIRGSAWIEPGSGTLWRVEMTLRPKPDPRAPIQFQNYLRVDFMRHAELKMMVPKEMRETFWIPGGLGEGRALYSNFRQFTTSARIVPQR